MTPDTTPATSRHLNPLTACPDVDTAIAGLVAALKRHQATITGVRAADPGRAQVLETAVERLATVRGRGGFYPYVGSGFGRGGLVQLADGSVKWDMITGIGVHGFGHGDPDLVETALRASMGDTVMQGNLMCNDEAISFAETLLEAARPGTNLAHCYSSTSGALANENGLKICMQHRCGAPRILAFDHNFMGRTIVTSQIGDIPGGRQGVPLSTLVDYLPFYEEQDPEGSLQRTMDLLERFLWRYPHQHSCIVIEPVQGEGGFVAAEAAWLRTVAERCREAGIPVWFDEVQSFGRTERMFRFQALGLEDVVDMVTVGKMSQVCATLYTAELNPKPGLLSATFLGGTVDLAVGRRIIERLMDGDAYGDDGRHAQLHAAFRDAAEGIIARRPGDFPAVKTDCPSPTRPLSLVGGAGGMMRLTPYGGRLDAIKPLLHRLYANGVVAFYCGHGPYHLRFLPPVGAMQPADITEVMGLLEQAMDEEG